MNLLIECATNRFEWVEKTESGMSFGPEIFELKYSSGFVERVSKKAFGDALVSMGYPAEDYDGRKFAQDRIVPSVGIGEPLYFKPLVTGV